MFNGRYGFDKLSGLLVIIFLILSIGTNVSRNVLWLYIVFLALQTAVIAILIYRFFSKDINARKIENGRFEAFLYKVRSSVLNVKKNMEDRKTHKVFKCNKCGQKLRVPRGKGKIVITCKKCGNKFEKTT